MSDQMQAAGSPAPTGSASLTYAEIVQAIKDAPRTWAGGLLITAARSSIEKRFFRDQNALLRVVRLYTRTSPNSELSGKEKV